VGGGGGVFIGFFGSLCVARGDIGGFGLNFVSCWFLIVRGCGKGGGGVCKGLGGVGGVFEP